MKAGTVGTAMLLVVATTRLPAQQVEAPARPKGELRGTAKRVVRGLMWTFDQPVHPVVGGVASGGGPGAGLGVRLPLRDPLHVGAKGLYTIRKYARIEANAAYEGQRLRLEGYGRMRDMKELSYFGVGAETNVDNKTDFRLRDATAGGRAEFELVPYWLTLSGRAERLWFHLGEGLSTANPTIRERFDDQTAPGLDVQPEFTRFAGGVQFAIPPALGEKFFQGAKYRATYSRFNDRELDHYSFSRVDLEAQHRFAILGRQRRLTLHGLVSMADPDDGNEVPFYMMSTLGGKGFLRSVHEDMLGSDGSYATLRGYPSFRFRDLNLLLLQAEYRIPVYGPIDITLFADAGKVTRERGDLDVSDLKKNYGFSVSLMKSSSTVFRLDFAFGGTEGSRILINLGKDIVP